MKKFLKEPLLHFLLLGAALFLVSGWIGGDETAEEAREIVVTEGQILSLIEQFRKVWQRPPTEQELTGLIDNYVREEVLYRQALALGLDKNDPIVRRRMRQKLEFVSEDIVDLAEPKDEELETYLESNADAYRLDARFTFRQVYLDARKRGENLQADIDSLLASLRESGEAANLDEAGDSLMLEQTYQPISQRDVAKTFGADFADGLLALPTGSWQGPVRSGFGVHLVYVSERIDGSLPTLEKVRDAVKRDWSAQRRQQSNDALYQKWLEGYTVTIEELGAADQEAEK